MRDSSARATKPTVKYRTKSSIRRNHIDLRPEERRTSANRRSLKKGRLALNSANRITNQLARETSTRSTSLHQEASVFTIAAAHAVIRGPGTRPNANKAAPLILKATVTSLLATIFELSTGSSKYMTLTTRK